MEQDNRIRSVDSRCDKYCSASQDLPYLCNIPSYFLFVQGCFDFYCFGMMLDCPLSGDIFIHMDVDVDGSCENDESPLKKIMLKIHTVTKSTVWLGLIK